MIQVILIVFVAMLIYSFMKAKREASIIQAQRDALNEKKNKAIESLNIKEKVSTIDKEDRVFISQKIRKCMYITQMMGQLKN